MGIDPRTSRIGIGKPSGPSGHMLPRTPLAKRGSVYFAILRLLISGNVVPRLASHALISIAVGVRKGSASHCGRVDHQTERGLSY